MDGVPQQRLPDAQWSTGSAPTEVQANLWQEAVDQAFVPVTVRPDVQGPFVSDVAVHRLGALELSRIASLPQTVSRSLVQVEREAGDVFFLNLPVSEGASVRQADREAHLAAGDFVVIDSDQPFELTFDRPFEQISLKLPRQLLHSRLLDTDDSIGIRVAGDQGMGAVAAASIRAAADHVGSLDARSSGLLGERLTDLVALALGGVRPVSRVPQVVLFQAALDEIDRSLSDPDLSPAAVAARVGVSVRYLHRMFSDQGPSFGRWLLLRRLTLARQDLVDPAFAQLSIGQVAARRGFTDASYFTRAFRRQYEVTPRAYRALSS